ncbi:MAG: DUF424 family protein [Thermoplasmata archaeon]|nr:DUF424 family protein [Thermoplasmata archaeon]
MYVRIHTHGDERIVAACDEGIIGMTFRGGDAKITVHEEFYRGESLSEEAFVERLRIATIINLVGEETVGIAIREGFISPESVMEIGGVKHAQAVLL